jgi:hypothetical protein
MAQQTLHLHRIIMIVPAAQMANFNAWVKANLDPGVQDWVTLCLSPTGQPPWTHGWTDFACLESELRSLMEMLCEAASIAPPPAWDNMPRLAKHNWLASQQMLVQNKIGVRVQHMDNDGRWDDSDAALTAMGLQRQVIPVPQ